MAAGVTAHRVSREERAIDQHDDAYNAEMEPAFVEACLKGINPEEDQNDTGEIEEVTMHILQLERK